MDLKSSTESTFNKTKIVATVGPACDTYDKLLALAKAGVNVFRLNFSHGTYEDKSKVIEHIRNINKNENFTLAILGDLQGPKLRLGELENGSIEIVTGDIITFNATERVIGTKNKIYVSYPNFHLDVKVGNKILIDDGKIEVVVIDVVPATGDVKVAVTYGGVLLPKKGVNLPDTEISLPALTEKDIADLDFILNNEFDWVALSFVRKTEDIINLKKRIADRNNPIKVIAKIEMPSAVLDIRNIILESDAVMVARGDLGVELPVEKVPLVQNEIIRKCIHRGKPVIVATQMMESMMDRVKPNRSEITDVANAVLEGADAVMLSGETAAGKHPVLVVETMKKIILEVEKTEYRYNRGADLTPQSHSPTFLSDAICYNACKMAQDVNANAILGLTQSGYTAFTLSSYRPKSPLFIFTMNKFLVNQLNLSWGVRAFYIEGEKSFYDTEEKLISILKEKKYLKLEDVTVTTGSIPILKQLPTNMLKVTKLK